MSIKEFIAQFPDENTCRRKFKEFRDEQGVRCPACGCMEHYWKKDKECYECKNCGRRQSLRANTLMHGSQLPFRYWFIAIYMVYAVNEGLLGGLSVSELQRQLNHKHYEAIWTMIQKIKSNRKHKTEQLILKIMAFNERHFSSICHPLAMKPVMAQRK